MALLDLQGMETPASELTHNGGHSSGSTQSCGAGSQISALLCEGPSHQSITLC